MQNLLSQATKDEKEEKKQQQRANKRQSKLALFAPPFWLYPLVAISLSLFLSHSTWREYLTPNHVVIRIKYICIRTFCLCMYDIGAKQTNHHYLQTILCFCYCWPKYLCSTDQNEILRSTALPKMSTKKEKKAACAIVTSCAGWSALRVAYIPSVFSWCATNDEVLGVVRDDNPNLVLIRQYRSARTAKYSRT